MNLKDYTRDASKVHSHLKELGDGSVVAVKGCKIYIPISFRDKNLASLGNDTYIVGIYMMTVEDKFYAVSLVNAMMRIDPSSINEVTIDDKDYFEFVFEPGDTVIASTDLVVSAKLLYYIFDAIVAKGNIPTYISYLDLGRLFDSAEKHAGTRLASTPTILHMLLSMIGRNPDQLMQYFRQVTNGKDFDKVAYVQLRSTTHGATNTTARLMGSHFTDNLTSALVNPSEREENIEHILRM
jgi:hypothetical protein